MYKNKASSSVGRAWHRFGRAHALPGLPLDTPLVRTKSKLLRRSQGGGQEHNPCASDGETESANGRESQQGVQKQQLQNELALALERCDEAEAYCARLRLQDDLIAVCVDAELQQFRAVECEREKWEEREQDGWHS